MKAYQLKLFTQQDRFHGGMHLSEWLVDIGKSHAISEVSVFMGATGISPDLRFPSEQMFDLLDHPVQITMIVTEEACERLFALLIKENLNLFYVKLPVAFGKVNE